MLRPKYLFLSLICLSILFGGGCQRKGLKCPKRSKNSSQLTAGNGATLQAISVPTNKKGLVKKKKLFGVL